MNQNTINQLGELALGSRLKRLSDYIMREGKELYKKHQIDFEPKWFPVFYALAQRESSSNVVELADELNVTHAAVSQVVKELVKKRLVVSIDHASDKRKKSLQLSEEGQGLYEQMKPLWQDIASALNNLLRENVHHLLTAIQEVESGFETKGFIDRVKAVTSKRMMDEVEIISFDQKYSEYFKTLNIEWLEKYFYVEDYDNDVLSNAEKYIIDTGGEIYFALLGGEVIGTCALMKHKDGSYELTKMAVTEKAQGRQAGKKLGLAVIEKARELGLKSIFLESNKVLTPALTLYERLGFKYGHKDSGTSAYERANVYMELAL